MILLIENYSATFCSWVSDLGLGTSLVEHCSTPKSETRKTPRELLTKYKYIERTVYLARREHKVNKNKIELTKIKWNKQKIK